MEAVIFEIVAIAVLTVFSAFFSGSETAFFSLRRQDLHRFSTSDNGMERSMAEMMRNPQQILITILLGNLMANLLVSMFSTRLLLQRWGDWGHWISIAVVTPFMILFCEIVPKIIALNAYEDYALRVYIPLNIIHKILWPIRQVLRFISEAIIRAFRLSLEHAMITEVELDHAVRSGQEDGILGRKEGYLIKNVLRFSKMEAANVMFPRSKALFIPEKATIEEAMEMFQNTGAIRAPVFKGDLDHITGMVDMRELLPSYLGYRKGRYVAPFIQEISFFPASRELTDLLNDFLEKRIQIAILLDEYGGTQGVVTLNAILSTLMGKDYNRYEIDTIPDVRFTSDGLTVVSGKMLIQDFNTRFGTKLESEHTDTMGGFFIEQFSGIPKRGDEIEIRGYRLRIRFIRRNRVESIEVLEGDKGND
jgi:putative hemolysin